MLACHHDLDVIHNLNGTMGNLGRDVESLEESSLAGFHSCVPSRNIDIHHSQSTSMSRGSNLVGSDEGANLFQVFIVNTKLMLPLMCRMRHLN